MASRQVHVACFVEMEQDFFDLLNRFEKSCQVHLQDVDEGFGPLLGPATSLVLGRDSSTYPYLRNIVVALLGIPSPRPACQKEKALRHMEYVDLGLILADARFPFTVALDL